MAGLGRPGSRAAALEMSEILELTPPPPGTVWYVELHKEIPALLLEIRVRLFEVDPGSLVKTPMRCWLWPGWRLVTRPKRSALDGAYTMYHPPLR